MAKRTTGNPGAGAHGRWSRLSRALTGTPTREEGPAVETLQAARDVDGLVGLFLGQDQQAAAAAAEALCAIGDAGCVERLLCAVREGVAEEDRRGLTSLIRAFGAEAVASVTREYLGGHPRTAAFSARMLESMSETAAWHFIKALKEAEPPVDDEVIALIQRMGEPALAALAERVRTGTEIGMESDLLVRIGAPAVDPMLRSWRPDDPRQLEVLTQICRRIGTPAIERLVHFFVAGPDPMRRATEVILAGLADVAWPSLAALAEGRGVSDLRIQTGAVGLLGRAPFALVSESLRRALGSTRAEVSRAARDALLNAGPEARAVLLEIAGTPRAQGRLAAIEATGYMHGSDAIDLLIKILDEPDSAVRQVATASLGRIGVEAAEPLSKALATGSYGVRSAADGLLRQWSRLA